MDIRNIPFKVTVQDGQEAGTTGQNLQLEALRVQVVPVGTAPPSV